MCLACARKENELCQTVVLLKQTGQRVNNPSFKRWSLISLEYELNLVTHLYLMNMVGKMVFNVRR